MSGFERLSRGWDHPGFDIPSVDEDGKVRIIEVKATAEEWGLRGVPITSTQSAAAEQRREEFWLYVVERAFTPAHPHTINDADREPTRPSLVERQQR